MLDSVARRDGGAFLFEDGRRFDLAAPIPPETGWPLENAFAIDELGLIAGTGALDGDRRAFLLAPNSDGGPTPDPIPEPAPMAVLALAAGWALLRRRRAAS